MNTENLTVDLVKSVMPGETRTFKFEGNDKVYSAKTIINRANNVYGKPQGQRWTYTTDMEDYSITIKCTRTS